MSRRATWRVVCALSALVANGCERHDDAEFVPRGHQELVVRAERSVTPLFIGVAAPIQACLPVGLQDDASQWEARWQTGGAAPAAFARPSVRLGRTICFDTVQPERLSEGVHGVCGEVRDGYDRRAVARGCFELEYRAVDATLEQLRRERAALLAGAGPPAVHGMVDSLLSLAERAERDGYPLFAFKLRMVASYQLRRSGSFEADTRAAELIESRPKWLDASAAAGASATLAYESALLSLERHGDDQAAWRELRRAEDLYTSVADPSHVVVALKQADILARAGAVAEARARLTTALERCEAGPCRADLLPPLRTTLAWVILLDPDADAGELRSATELLRVALSSESLSSDPVERANIWTNLAYAQARRGEPFDHAQLMARELLDRAPLAARARAREVRAWTDLVAGLAELIAGRDARALVACSNVSGADSPQLEAWAAGCRARAWVDRGMLDSAAQEFDSALSAHLRAAPSRAGAELSLGPGRRADDFYEAARLEIQRGRLRQAWDLLAALDSLPLRTAETHDLSSAALGPSGTSQLGRELDALRQPVATGIQKARRELVVQWRDRAQESLRLRREGRRAPPTVDGAIAFRAIALADEVLLLNQRPGGEVVLVRRTPWPRARMRAALAAVRTAMDQGGGDDQHWFELTKSLAAALVPESWRLGPLTTVALHGVLQSVPLAALPQFEATAPGAWLQQETVVALVPAQARARSQQDGELETRPLFVVDPNANLKGTHRQAAAYRQRFAAGQLLEGRQATREAVSRALATSRWLHLDVHANYDDLFPELSTIELADGPIVSADLERWGSGLRFVNLSGCGTGRWPETADSGRYGIAGDLARSGVPWVVATRTDLPNAVAVDLNDALYACLGGSGSIPGCYGDALRAVAAKHPPAAWAGLVLIHAPSDSARENPAWPTPLGSARQMGAQP